MEERKNLYMLDDFCIILSYILFGIFIFLFRRIFPLLAGAEPERILQLVTKVFMSRPLLYGGVLFSTLFFQIVGRVVRRKEKLSLQVINALGTQGRYSLSSLSFELGRSEESLKKTLTQLAAFPGAGISFDGVNVKKKRPSKPGKPQAAQPFQSSGFSDPSDTSKFSGTAESDDTSDQWNEEEFTQAQPSFSPGADKKFNFILFFFLFFVFWPAAFIYAARFAIQNSQKKALFGQDNQDWK